MPVEQKRFNDMMDSRPPPQYNPHQGGPPRGAPPKGAPMGAPNPLINLQVYQPPKPKPRDFVEQDINKLDASMFLPAFGTNPFFAPQYGVVNGIMQPQMPMLPTLIKNYNIQAPNPTGLHEKMAYIYEDMLPTINIPGKIITLKDRNNLQFYLRSILFSRGDGVDINLDERSNSLMQYMKYMDLNPYNNYNFSTNPYMSLPDDFLIYRSCYPIQKEGDVIKCAKNSIGINVRVYNLTNAEYNIYNPVPPVAGIEPPKKTDFDTWREISCYTYIRDNIIKKSRCPNFINMIGYFINEKSNIDFNKLKLIKGTFKGKPMEEIKVNYDGKEIIIANPQASTQKALIVLTEAPQSNLYGWCSTQYQRAGMVKKMISTGYYTDSVWYSILFQIMIALYILQKEGICLENFSIEDNVFIQYLSLHSNLTNFWKYKVDGIEYYVPNHGFLAQIDLSFQKVEGKPRKIDANFFEDEVIQSDGTKTKITITEDDIYNNMFIKVFDDSIFKADTFKNKGGMSPPPSVLSMLNQIRGDTSSKNIGYYIKKYFTRFLNNRVGTYLKELELPNIRRNDINLEKGNIYVQEVESNTYKFVIYINDDETNPTLCKILTKENKNEEIIEKIITKGTLLGYNRGETIEQTFKPNEINLNEDDLLETYIVS